MSHFDFISAESGVEASITAATHLTPADAAAVAALRVLAKKVDSLADSTAGVSDDGELTEDRKRGLDNVTLPTFLKFCSELGLTPAGRHAIEGKKTESKSSGGRLAHLKSVQGGRPA